MTQGQVIRADVALADQLESSAGFDGLIDYPRVGALIGSHNFRMRKQRIASVIAVLSTQPKDNCPATRGPALKSSATDGYQCFLTMRARFADKGRFRHAMTCSARTALMHSRMLLANSSSWNGLSRTMLPARKSGRMFDPS